ncbi:pilus assembly protein PilM [Patescibacteria group bacterium]|nr:pilus assembly protein PilM [Patescibacteria group bacterium]
MFNLSKFTSIAPKNILGIDMGTASIKVVELSKSRKGINLVNYGILEAKGHLERINDAIQTSSLDIMDAETAETLSLLLKNMKTSVKDVVLSLPAFSAFTSLLELPEMAADETSQAMRYQAKALVPMPLDQVTIDWLRIGKYKNEHGNSIQKVILIAVPTKQIQKYQSICQRAGLNLKALELETVSLARVLTGGDSTLSIIVDIGARSTAFAIASGGALIYSAQADFAGSSLTHALAKGLGINVLRAEELKKQKGLMGTGGEYEVSTLMLPYLDVIINEAKRVIEGHEKNHQEKVDRVILSGGSANLLGIEKYVSDKLKMSTIKADPFGTKISYPQAAAPVLKNVAPALSVALGLGSRVFLNDK